MAADDDARAEAEGQSVGEAKRAAFKELERDYPGLTQDAVEFEVLEEPDEDEGRTARVAAAVDLERWEEGHDELPDEPGDRVRAVVARVVLALELEGTVDIEENADEIRATVNGPDLGLLIGRHGSTIDALQDIASRAAYAQSPGDRKRVVVDAAGDRERREATLKRQADRAVADALDFGRAVELEPMGPHERKVVHNYLADRGDVETHSEGDEPERRLVVKRVGELAARYGVEAEPLERLLEALAAEPDPPTTVADPVRDHLADSLAVIPLIDPPRRVADIGSGAGFPGLVLAASFPRASVFLVESQRRHAAVAQRLGTEAGLSNVRVLPVRVEEVPEREAFDLVTARAVAPLAVLVELLTAGGRFVAWKGARDEEEELAAARAAATVGLAPEEVVKVEPFPGAHSRHLHFYVKTAQTPDRFPRRPGMARKRPLA
jgi:16S rRNA (guanine(527)-N(7))-methyltransferase RsmG